MNNKNTIIVKYEDYIATIMLNRPDVRNAMNDLMISELTTAFEEAGRQNDIRLLILRGNGKSFCAGADLNYMKSISGFGVEENVRDAQKLAALFKTVYDCPVPTLAVVHGAAFGGANGLLAACDIVITEENTTFAFSEVKLGIAPETIAPFVVKRIGEYGAKELMTTGKRFKAREAEKWHLVNQVVTETEMEEVVDKYIKEFMSSAPGAVKATKELIRKVTEAGDISKELIDYTAEKIAELRAAEEGQEGMAAFLEKRKANWVKSSDQ
ncbi:MAG: enoyl-CoA hydratase/isomerase family protein [Chlorobi bacterium]|nr:enoyl-CoA hydratase/isomerase family protein [Chlorobiota bacterium]